MLDRCQVESCSASVSKSGHSFCLNHWKAEKAGKVIRCKKCDRWHDNAPPFCRGCECAPTNPAAADAEDDSSAGLYSSTRLGKYFGLSNIKINLILAELGWIEKYVKGWVPTDRGNALRAEVREARNGVPFVVWPGSILGYGPFVQSVREQGGLVPALHQSSKVSPSSSSTVSASTPPSVARVAPRRSTPTPTPAPIPVDDFRTKFPANFRTQDGHQVRSRAEVLIDNWLYMQGLVHAYERRLPIEEECYCDFYLPGGGSSRGGGVYIEFWGMESDSKYTARQAAKRAIYTKHNLRLIELNDADIERLDDVLPRMLLKFGIESA